MNGFRIALLSFAAACLATTTAVNPLNAYPSTPRQDDVIGKAESQSNESMVVEVTDAILTLIDNVKVSARDPGIVSEVLIQEGDLVTKEQLILRLDDALHKSELEAAKVEVEIAATESENDIDLKYAEKSAQVNDKVLTRSQNAVDQYAKSISETELDRLRLELQRSILSGDQALHAKQINQLTLRLKEEQLKVAALRLENREIASPISGVVAEVFAQKGEWIASGQPIARIIDPKRLRVEALAGQEYAFVLEPGQRARFEMQIGKNTIVADGKIVFVSPEISPVNAEFLVWVEIENSDLKFKPGLRGILRLFAK